MWGIGLYIYTTNKTSKKFQHLNTILEFQIFENHAILENANCGILHVTKDGRLKHVNTQFATYFGGRRKLQTLQEYLSLLDKQQKENFIHLMDTQKETTFEQSFFNYNGKEINLNIYLSFLPKNEDMIVIATSREDKLALQDALYKSKIFFNHSDLGQIILDSSYNIIEVNIALCKFTHYKFDEMQDKPFGLFFPSQEKYKNFVQKYLVNSLFDTTTNLEYELQKKDGTLFWVEMFGKKFKNGSDILYIWSIRDISVRVESRNIIKKLNEKLQDEFTKLEEIIDVIPMPIFIKDKNFLYTGCNQAFCDFHDLPKQSILGKSVFNLFDDEKATFFHHQDLQMKETSSQVYQTTFNNAKTIIEIYKKTLYSDNGFNGFVGVIIDITQKEQEKLYLEARVQEELKKNEASQKKHQKELIKNAKFSTIGKMAAGITHEINTPLTYIKGNFEMLYGDVYKIKDDNLKNSMLGDCKSIEDGIERIANIINSMREISQKSSENKEYINIYETLISALTLTHNKAKHIVDIYINEQKFNLQSPKDAHTAIAYIQKQRVEQVWIIIINNALDELIKIKQYDDRKLHITLSSDTKHIYVKIKDNGGGISDKIMPILFEPFESSKESSGIGIGLNIAKQIIKEQKASIYAFNEDDGAVFEIKFKKAKSLH
jgi:PAS domain S-box-containing protein